ncbi:hypothetical protein ACS5NO_20740 [Larkinella sp. GY13]|uniref:hypothetical protein n=1 Tax=Larkinella sp. GY13 TaxID=3453720 RepID=UPI003EF001AE
MAKVKTPPAGKAPEPATDQDLKQKAQQKLEALLKSREGSDEPDASDESEESDDDPDE